MSAKTKKYLSIKLTRFSMKIIGFWNVSTRKERLILRCNYLYMLTILSMCTTNQVIDLTYCQNDLSEATYIAAAVLPCLTVGIKAITFMIRKKEVMWLITQSQKHIWHKKYDEYGKKLMDNVDKRIIFLIFSYTLLIYATSFVYMLYGITESIGKTGEDRIHPLRFRLIKRPTITPYYEAIFVLETISTTHVGICFCCFDNFLYILIMQIECQFKILRNKMESIFAGDDRQEKSIRTYREFKNCIDSHHLLLLFLEKLECVFSFPLMCQLLMSSLVLCVSGFQLITHHQILMKKILFLVYIIGGFIQIFLITMNCDNIIQESGAMGNAIYNSNWADTPYDVFNRFRKDMITVMLRSKRPSNITAAKFFPISLQSFTNVLSTTASYLTLLRTMDDEVQ